MKIFTSYHTILSWLVFLACACAYSCNKEQIPVTPEVPSGVAELIAACESGDTFKGIERQSARTVIYTGSGRSISIAYPEVVFHEILGDNIAAIDVDDKGVWTVDGVSTGIPCDPYLPKNKAFPFYNYFTKEKLVINLSNKLSFSMLKVLPHRNIPTITIETQGRQEITSKETYLRATITIKDPDHCCWDTDEFSAPTQIRGRGNSTWSMPKKPYKIKLDEKARLFDISNDKEWCLLANYADKSLIRNITAMEISRICGMEWTPGMVSCEVTLNGKYLGVYTFSEHKKVSKERVNINLDAGDLLFEIDQDQNEPVCWITDHGMPMMFSEPSEPSAEVIATAKQMFATIESELWAKNFSKVYSLIDTKSFINQYIIQELTKNIDGNLRKSSFICWRKGGKLEMPHVWDFDLTMGNADYFDWDAGNGPEGWWVRNHSAIGLNHGWYYRLFMDPEWCRMVKARWNELYPELKGIPAYIDAQVELIGPDAVARNFKVWNFKDNGWWNASHKVNSYADEIAYFKDFYTKRLEWLNKQINSL